jgi:single-stranded DNA-binding protein
MDSLNLLIVSGALDRAPQVRFREDGACVCTGTLRLEEQGTQGTVFKTFLPFEAYGKVGEHLGTWHEGDLGTLQGKVCWRKYHTKGGEEKSGLALLVQKSWRLVPATAPVMTDGSV